MRAVAGHFPAAMILMVFLAFKDVISTKLGARMKKRNCWEVMNCGRQPGGENVAALGECPTASCLKADGINKGTNGGRACWAIAGTFSGKEIQGTFAVREGGCAVCDFFHLAQKEEGAHLVPVYDIIEIISERGSN